MIVKPSCEPINPVKGRSLFQSQANYW